MTSVINLNNFKATKEYTSNSNRIFAGLPDKKRYFKVIGKPAINIWVIRKPNGWHLVQNALAESGEVEKAVQADLYFAIYQDGEEFIIVNTKDTNGKANSWYKSMNDIIENARENWVKCKERGSEEKHRYIVSDDDSVDLVTPSITLQDCVKSAFDNRIIANEDVEDF